MTKRPLGKGPTTNDDYAWKDVVIGICDPGGYWWPPTKSTWTPTIISLSFSISLIVAQFTIFNNFLGPELSESF